MEKIQKIMNFLSNNTIQILSTIKEISNMPNSRPFGSAMLLKNKIWYCMNNNKNTFIEMMTNPNICICVYNSDRSWIRIYTKAIFSDDKEIKAIYLERPTNSFKSVNDPLFSVFYLSDIKAEIHTKGNIEYIEIPDIKEGE